MKTTGDIRVTAPVKAENLAGMINVQPGAVVSRTIIDKKTGTVTVFAFDEGQGLSEHTAPFDAMVTVLEGRVEIKIGGTSHTLEAGEMIVMPAGIPHGLSALAPMKMVLVMIREK
jgi:quercetin dioxygenase-like cupin family protein